MLLSRTEFPVLCRLQMELDQLVLKPLEDLVILEVSMLERSLLELETGCALDGGAELIKVTVLIIEV